MSGVELIVFAVPIMAAIAGCVIAWRVGRQDGAQHPHIE